MSKTRKTRLLIANDASMLGTGYAVYGKELLTRLADSGKYEIAELACYCAKENQEIVNNKKWKIYPNAVNNQDPRWQPYSTNIVNQFGAWRFNQVALHFKPDIVFDIRDYWMYSYQETSPLRPHFKWVIMPTVDSAPQKEEWLYTFANADLVVPYTDWAMETLSNQCGKNINLFPKIANAGVNLDMFRPSDDKKALKKEMFGNENISIVGAVMRNQKRKLFPDLFMAYRKYLDRLLEEGKTELYKNSFLYLHTSYPEENGWDLPKLLLENRLLDKTYCTYSCRMCKSVYPAKFTQAVGMCKNCNAKSVVMPSASNPVPSNTLAQIYTLFDLFVQYAICEGFGMPQVEAAACGVPVASVDYSAMSEIARKLEGVPIPVKRMFRELETGADRAYPDIDFTTKLFYKFFVDMKDYDRISMSKRTRKLAERYYSWDDVFTVWDKAFDSVDISTNLPWDKPNPRPINLSIQVPQDLPPVEFVEFILNNIVNEPYLINVASVRTLVKNFGTGIFPNKGNLSTYSYQDVIKILEIFVNNKKAFEEFKKNPEQLFKEDYLDG